MKGLRRFGQRPEEVRPAGVAPADPIDRSDEQLITLLNRGRVLPRYRLHGRLGHGGSARTLAVVDHQLQRTVAVKFIDCDDPHSADDLRREREALTSLAHPNIPALLEADGDHDTGLAWLILPLIGGAPLAFRVNDQPPLVGGWREACAYLLPIAEALAEAHRRGIVHGDVAPGNILCHPAGECLLIDWGSSSRPLEPDNRRHRCTPPCAAPELLDGGRPSVGSDVYGFGACLYLLLHGHLPRRDGQSVHLERGDLPRRCRAVLGHCLAAQPEQRYESMDELVADLRALVLDRPVAVCPEGPGQRLWRWTRRRPGMAATLTVAGIALVFAVSLLIEQQHSRERIWRTVLDEDFSQPLHPGSWSSELFPLWERAQRTPRMVGGEDSPWYQTESQLRTRWTDRWNGCVAIRYERPVGSDVRVRWTCSSPGGPVRNLNIFLGADRYVGWCVHIAGYGDPASITLTDGRFMPMTIVARQQLAEALQPDRPYRLQVELVEDLLCVWIDGREVLRHRDPFHIDQHRDLHIGLETGGAILHIEDFQIDELQRPLREDLLRIPSRLLAAGANDAALREYRSIDEERLDDDGRAWRRLQMGHCLQALAVDDEARRQWRSVFDDASLAARWRSLAGFLLGQQLLDDRDWSSLHELAGELQRVPLDRRIGLLLWRQICDALDQDSPRWQGDAAAMTEHLQIFFRSCRLWADRLGLTPSRLETWELPDGLQRRVDAVREDLLLPRFETEIVAINRSLLQSEGSDPLPRGKSIAALPDTSLRLPTVSSDDDDRPAGDVVSRLAPSWQYNLLHDRLMRQLQDPVAHSDIVEARRSFEVLPVSQACPPLLKAQIVALLHCGLAESASARASLQAGLDHPQTAAAIDDSATVQAMLAGLPLPEGANAWQRGLAADIAGQRSAAVQAYRQAMADDSLRQAPPHLRMPEILLTWRCRQE